MRLVRELERRLERLVEAPGRVVGGTVTPAELGARIQREADLALDQGSYGPVAPNRFEIRLHPRDREPLPGAQLASELEALVEALAAERGWRLEGPAKVDLEEDASLRQGAVTCTTSVRVGIPFAWARLISPVATIAVHHNRSVIGRDEACDLVISHRAVSRRHALLWQETGSAWIRDLGSTNGTYLDGSPVTGTTAMGGTHLVGLGPVAFRFERL